MEFLSKPIATVEPNSITANTEIESPSFKFISSTVALIMKFESIFLAEPSEITGRSLIVTDVESKFSAEATVLDAEN